MSKNNYPGELINLVEEYLTDGIITAKEREVLLNKAHKMGVDRDEFDLYIDAQQQKADQQIDAAASKKRGKTCPFCGTPVPQLADKCPQCGQFITPEASEELKKILDELEEALVDFKAGKDVERTKATVERYSRKARMYYGNNPKMKPLLNEVETEMLIAEKRAKSIERSQRVNDLIKNPWTWIALEIIIVGIIAILIINEIKTLFDEGYDYEEMALWVVGLICFVVAGASAIIASIKRFVKK